MQHMQSTENNSSLPAVFKPSTPPRHSMSHLKRMYDIEQRLGAWMCRDEDFEDNKDNPLEFESKARTFLCFLENVFGRFYEFKTRICDYDDIPATYGSDWDNFQADVCSAVKESRPFNGICPVMHIQTAAEGNQYVIKNIGIRPCAIEQSFFRVLLKHIAASLPDGKQLVVKIFGIRMEFMNTVIRNLQDQIKTFPEPRRTKEDMVNVMGRKLSMDGHNLSVEVVTLDTAHIEALRELNVPWTDSKHRQFPSATALNDSKSANPKRIELIRRMITAAQSLFAEYLNHANDSTNYLPDALNLDENGLWVFKGSIKLGYCLEERRFFMRESGRYAELYLDRDSVPRASIDSMLTRSTIRIELMGGKYVFFIRPQDFARKSVAEGKRQEIGLEKDVKRFIKTLIINGEKIIGINGNSIVMTSSSVQSSGDLVTSSSAQSSGDFVTPPSRGDFITPPSRGDMIVTQPNQRDLALVEYHPNRGRQQKQVRPVREDDI